MIYHNRDGLEKGFIEEYSKDLLKGLDIKCSQDKKQELEKEIKKEMEGKLLTNLESILERAEARGKNIEKVEQERQRKQGEKHKELDNIARLLEENNKQNRVENNNYLTQLLYNNPDFKNKLNLVLEKGKKEQKGNNAL